MLGISSLISAAVAFAAVFGMGYVFIPFLKRVKFGQTIREEGPKWHNSKQGTPTMGGIMILFGIMIAVIFGLVYGMFCDANIKNELSSSFKTSQWIAGFGLTISMCIIGLIDDYIKVVKKRNLGLTAMQKTFAQLLVSAGYLVCLILGGMSETYIPFIGNVNVVSGAGLIFWPIALMFIYGFTNAVNLTDGIDGLASSVTLIVCCTFMVLSGVCGFCGANLLASAGAGACIGFVMWNAHPAKVFMGDTGSMLLGGLVVGLSFSIGMPILLIPAGIVYLLEALSVILQVAHYKRTKKRIFKMTPIHHHFEMCGWSEEKIVFIFSLITLLGGILAILAGVLRV